MAHVIHQFILRKYSKVRVGLRILLRSSHTGHFGALPDPDVTRCPRRAPVAEPETCSDLDDYSDLEVPLEPKGAFSPDVQMPLYDSDETPPPEGESQSISESVNTSNSPSCERANSPSDRVEKTVPLNRLPSVECEPLSETPMSHKQSLVNELENTHNSGDSSVGTLECCHADEDSSSAVNDLLEDNFTRYEMPNEITFNECSFSECPVPSHPLVDCPSSPPNDVCCGQLDHHISDGPTTDHPAKEDYPRLLTDNAFLHENPSETPPSPVVSINSDPSPWQPVVDSESFHCCVDNCHCKIVLNDDNFEVIDLQLASEDDSNAEETSCNTSLCNENVSTESSVVTVVETQLDDGMIQDDKYAEEEFTLAVNQVTSNHSEPLEYTPPWCEDTPLLGSCMDVTTATKPKQTSIVVLIENYLGPVYKFSEGVKRILVKQARDILVCHYGCDLIKFEALYLQPVFRLLSTLKEILCQKSCWACSQGYPVPFPFCTAESVVVHLREVEATLLRNGDFYFRVQPSATELSPAELFICYQTDNIVHTQPIPPHLYPQLLTMDSLAEHFPCEEEDDKVLVESLKNLVVTLEKGLERLQWEAFVYNWGENSVIGSEDENEVQKCFVDISTGIINLCQSCQCVQGPKTSTDTANVDHVDAGGVELTAVPTTNHSHCKNPISVIDLKSSLLESGALYLPGVRTKEGSDIVVFEAAKFPDDVTHEELIQLMCYFNSVRRKGNERQLLTVVTSAMDIHHPKFALLRECLVNLKEEFKILIKECIVVVEEDTPSDVQHDLLLVTKCSWESKCQLAERLNSDLPDSLGGGYAYSHSLWLEFRRVLEPFVLNCRSAGQILMGAMSHIKSQPYPECANQAKEAIQVQKQVIGSVLENEAILRLIEEGENIVDKLQAQSSQMPDSYDLSDWSTRASMLYTEVRKSSISLRKMADRRLSKLDKFLRLQDAEEESGEVLTWLCQKGEETLKRHKNLADSLAGIRQQEKEFEKFYFVAMRNIEKGNDLIEDTDVPNNNCQENVQDLTKTLKYHLKSFTERLEETREKLEDSSRCYLLLDQSYEWALDAMKYMAYIKPEEGCIPEVSKHLLEHLDQYLELHPPISANVFEEMLEIAARLENAKLLDQCKIAKSRCEETWELIQTRRKTLVQVTNSAKSEHESSGNSEGKSILNKLFSTNRDSKHGHARRKSVGSGLTSHSNSNTSRKVSCGQCSCTDDCIYMNCRHCVQIAQETLGNIAESCENKSLPSDPLTTPKCRKKLNKSKTWQEYNPEFLHQVFDKVSNCYKDGHPFTRSQSYYSSTAADLHSKSPIYQNVPNRACNFSSKSSPISVNSHLECRSSSLDLAVHMSGDEFINLKNKKTILMIMQEMIQTERDYVNSLEYVIEHYVPELFRDDIPQALRGQRNVVFGNIEKIYEFHTHYFLKELQMYESSPLQVGQCFLRHEQQFYLYALYNKNKPKSESLMSEYGSTFFKKKQVELGDRMDLGSYLLKPVQRMGKYALLLKQLLKECPSQIQEYGELSLAEEMVRFQLRHGNDLLAMDSLRDCDVNLKEQGRLLRQDEFVVWQAGGVKTKKCLRHVFLFEDLILFSKSRRDPERKNLDLYVYKHSIKMTDIGMTEKILEGKTRFEIWFRKRKPNDTFVLQAPSTDVKNAWTNEISRLLWKQALRNRELRLAEMCSMGIGNKPCLDIKASEDQINDRSIHVTKVPRFRNSIASSSGGENPVINKRPQSIISMSSSSSGSSSQSSTCGLLNLGFDPVDSPKTHHRSVTIQSQCSTESGILVDFGGMFCEDESSNSSVQRSNSTVTSISTDSDFISLSPLVNTPHRNDHMVTEL